MFRIFNKIIILSVFIPLCAFSQKKNIVFDVDSIPVCIENKNVEKEMTYSYFLPVQASTNIEYNGGRKSLVLYGDSCFCSSFKESECKEKNAYALYTILFDSSLHIKDIHIIHRFGYDNVEYNYDTLIKKILFSTEGSWMKKKGKASEWYLYSGRFHLI
jgi:hypothetical protein